MFRFIAAVSLTFIFLMPQEALARRGGIGGEREVLLFVAPTEHEAADGKPLSLCIKQHQYHFFFLSGWATQEYVLAENRCDDEGYYDYSPAALITDKLLGRVDADVPPEPAWNMQTIGNGFALWFAAAALGLGGMLVKRTNRQPVSRHEKLLGKLPEDVIKMADVMIHAARLEGRVTRDQVALIKEMLEEFTPAEVDEKTVAKLIKGSERALSDKAIARLADGTEPDTRLAFLRGAMDVLRADGKVSKHELKFMVRLGKGLGISDDEIETVYQDFGQVAA